MTFNSIFSAYSPKARTIKARGEAQQTPGEDTFVYASLKATSDLGIWIWDFGSEFLNIRNPTPRSQLRRRCQRRDVLHDAPRVLHFTLGFIRHRLRRRKIQSYRTKSHVFAIVFNPIRNARRNQVRTDPKVAGIRFGSQQSRDVFFDYEYRRLPAGPAIVRQKKLHIPPASRNFGTCGPSVLSRRTCFV